MIVLILFLEGSDVFVGNGLERGGWYVKEFHESFSDPEGLLLLIIVGECVSSSDVLPVEGMLDIHFVLIGTSGIQTEINDFNVFVPDMLVSDILDGIFVF